MSVLKEILLNFFGVWVNIPNSIQHSYFYLIFCSLWMCNILVIREKTKRKEGVKTDFQFARAPHLTPLPITHFHPPLFSLLAGCLYQGLSFSFFYLYLNTHTHTLTSTLTHRPPLQSNQSSPSFFQQDHWKDTQEPQSIFITLFEVKVLISFDGYYVLV